MFSGLLASKSEEQHVSYFLIWNGEKGRDIYNTWEVTREGSLIYCIKKSRNISYPDQANFFCDLNSTNISSESVKVLIIL